MSYNKIIFFLFISSFGIYIQNVKAQALNINGDTIFVNTKAEVLLVFPTLPTSFTMVPVNIKYRIWDSPSGINLIAQSEDYQPVTLLITEAQRRHRFILVYKQGNSNTKFFYDYSTEKKLAQHISETPFSKSIEPENKKKKKQAILAGSVDSISIYYSLLEKGDKYVLLEKYQDAKLSYDKAHTLRPDEITPLLKLDAIKPKLGEIQKSEQEKDKKYFLLTEEAQNKTNQKKYTEARNIYTMALDLKPGDAYVTQQLQAINNLVAEENAQKKKSKIDIVNRDKIEQAKRELNDKQLIAKNNYDTTVKSADNFFNAGDYENAKREYTNALKYGNKDWPRLQINKINKIISQANADKKRLEQQQQIASEQKIKTDSILTVAEIKNKYNLAIAMGRSSYQRNDLSNAKAFYEEAMSLQPSQQLPKNQLKIINNKLADSIRAADLNNDYDRVIALADSLVITKAYDSAIASYKQASLLMPLESYAFKQVKYIQSQLVQNEKKKKQENEEQYNSAITSADKAVTDKRYDDAKSAYEEALSIHPDNEYAKRRLEIISYQLEKARIDKLSQDSMKETVPVKRSRRKKSS